MTHWRVRWRYLGVSARLDTAPLRAPLAIHPANALSPQSSLVGSVGSQAPRRLLAPATYPRESYRDPSLHLWKWLLIMALRLLRREPLAFRTDASSDLLGVPAGGWIYPRVNQSRAETGVALCHLRALPGSAQWICVSYWVPTLNCGASNALWPHGFAAQPQGARTFPRESVLFRNPSGAQGKASEMFRCFHCDELLALDPEFGAVHPGGGALTVSCPDCSWRGALHSPPLRCPDCGGLRLRDDHRAVLSHVRRGDGARIVLREVSVLPAGKLPAAESSDLRRFSHDPTVGHGPRT